MKPTPLTLPSHLAKRLLPEVASAMIGVGNPALLAEPLLGFVASRQCPGHVFIETLECVPQWVSDGRVLVSGFHSPLEQQVLRSLLRRQGRAVRLLARHLPHDRDYRPAAEECDPLAQGCLLILSASPATESRTTRASSLVRNRLVRQLVPETYEPLAARDSQ